MKSKTSPSEPYLSTLTSTHSSTRVIVDWLKSTVALPVKSVVVDLAALSYDEVLGL